MASHPAVPILHHQPQLFVPPSQETGPSLPGSYSGSGMLCQHFCMDSGPRGRGKTAGSADLAPKRDHLPYPYSKPHLSPWEDMVGRTKKETAPPSLVPSLSPTQSPEKRAILGETPVVPSPIPAPSWGSEIQGDRTRGRAKCRRLKPKDNRQRQRHKIYQRTERDFVTQILSEAISPHS